MKLKLRRASTSATGVAAHRPASWVLPAGTVLGWFVEARLQFEVQLAAEHRLWLRTRSDAGDPGYTPLDVGPIVWDEYRSPHLDPVPEWLDASALSTAAIVLKATALYRAVVRGEGVDPNLGVNINVELGDLVYESRPEPRSC